MSLTETMWAVDQLGAAFWFALIPERRRHWEQRDPEVVERVFRQALTYGIEVGLTAGQVADAAFYGRGLAIDGKTPVCLAGRSFEAFASDVAACLKKEER